MFPLLFKCRFHFGIFDIRVTENGLFAVIKKKHFIEHDRVAFFVVARQLLDRQIGAGKNLILLPSCLYHCELCIHIARYITSSR